MKINIIKIAELLKLAVLLVAIIVLLFPVIKNLPDATPIIYPPVNNSATSIGR